MAHYRILIVDDHRDTRRLFSDALHSLGSDVDILEMPSAEEALFVTTGAHVDLVISDVYLPGISGLQMIKRIRRNNPTLKIILITGATDPKVKDEVANSGAEAFFYKPVDITELIQTVRGYKEAGEPETPQVSQVQAPPEKAQAPEAKSTPTIDLEGPLAALIEQVNARAAALMSDEGMLLASVGDFNAHVGPDLLGRLSAVFKAGLAVSRSMKVNLPESLMSFAGPDTNLCLVPVGSSFSLAVVGGRAFQASLLSSGKRMAASAAELLKLLETPRPVLVEVTPAPAEEHPPAEDIPLVDANPEDVAALGALLTRAPGTEQKAKEADDFWNTLAEQTESDGQNNRDIISYEEARKQGLAPE